MCPSCCPGLAPVMWHIGASGGFCPTWQAQLQLSLAAVLTWSLLQCETQQAIRQADCITKHGSMVALLAANEVAWPGQMCPIYLQHGMRHWVLLWHEVMF